MDIFVESNSYQLRQLNFEDNLNDYLYWMQTPSNNQFILSASPDYDLFQLKQFIKTCNNRADVVLLGIFTKVENLHIGNIKFDEINFQIKTATMGILIGNESYRGKGVAREVIIASAAWLQDKFCIETLRLGVSKDNVSALRLYLKLGFKITEETKSGGFLMKVLIKELIQV